MESRSTTLPDRTLPEPNSPTERVFQFISDPRHKENLSGRVRAACITCRRKKIKCSGEINCRTCQEKGIVCEGLPDRKRPKRDSFDKGILDPLPAGVDQTRKLSASRKPSLKKRPVSLLKLPSATKSEDSGYGSLSPVPPNFSDAAGEVSSVFLEQPRPANVAPPAPFRVDIWDLEGERMAKSQSDGEMSLGPSDISPDTVAKERRRRKSSDDGISWWTNSHTRRVDPEREDLSSAARVLFGGTTQPARTTVKPSEVSIDLDGMPLNEPSLVIGSHIEQRREDPEALSNRRQTVQFPLSVPAGEGLPDLSLLTHQPGIFDEMALLLTGKTSIMSDSGACASWWDMNTGIGSTICQAGVSNEVPNEEPKQLAAVQVPESPLLLKRRALVGNFYW